MEIKAVPGARCRQSAGISTSSSGEWEFVLTLVMISMCEELQYFFSEWVRNTVKSYGIAAFWQTLQVQPHKCYGAPVVSTSSRTFSMTAGWAPCTSPRRGSMQHQASSEAEQL